MRPFAVDSGALVERRGVEQAARECVAQGVANQVRRGRVHRRCCARVIVDPLDLVAGGVERHVIGGPIGTQDDELAQRLDPVQGGRRLANFIRVMTMEAQVIARACGKARLHSLEPEDLVALTIEAAAMARVPLAGTSWIPGQGS